jgi:hypothetical protein
MLLWSTLVVRVWPPRLRHRTAGALFSGVPSGVFSLGAQSFSVGGWPVLRDFLEGVSNLFLGGRQRASQLGTPAAQPLHLLVQVLYLLRGVLCVFLCIGTGHETLLSRTSDTMHEPG